MSDNLTIFGKNYSTVAGFKAKDTNNNTLSFIRPVGTVSISSNSTVDVTNYAIADVNVQGGSTSQWETLYDDTARINSGSPNYISISNFTQSMGANEQWKVNFNGTEWTLDTEYSNMLGTYFIGNGALIDGTEVPNCTFVMYKGSSSTLLVGTDESPGEITLVIEKLKSSGGGQTINNQTTYVIPTELQQTVTPDASHTGLSTVTVAAIPSTYVGSGVSTKSSSDLTASGATVTAPAGYYAAAATKAVSSGSVSTPASTITANPSISVSNSGLITATASASSSITPTVSAGYISSGTAGTVTVSGSSTSQLSTVASSTITPSESQQTAVAANKYTTGEVKIAAIPTTYIGSGVTQRSSSSLTVSGPSVTAPAGYYSSSATTSVASGSAGTPTATKGTVSNHAVTVTPSVTNSTGWIIGSTKTGFAVTVSASELVSGSETKTANGTYDVTNLASLVVAIPFSTITVSSSNPTGGSNGDVWIKTS